MGGKRPFGTARLRRANIVEARVRPGDTVIDRGGLKGRVVANIDRDEFSAECPRGEWAYLTHGILVNTDEAGLVHYETAEELSLIANA